MTDADGSVELSTEEDAGVATSSAPRLPLSDVSPVRLATAVGLGVVVALVALCGWLGFQAHQVQQQSAARALFLQVGRQAALNLTTIDFAHVDDDVKRILDSATGDFYDEFEQRSGPFKDVVKKTESKSVGTITEAALESVTGDEGQVMVAVAVKSTNKAVKGEQEPRFWRMRINVQKFGSEAKVTKVDFVP